MTKHSEALKSAALKAGIVDVDALALGDMTKDDGTAKAAAELVASLKMAKPFLFGRHVRDMTPQEAAAKLAELRKGPKPAAMDMSKTAREMTPAERDTFLKECARR